MSSIIRQRVVRPEPIKTPEMEIALYNHFESKMRVIVPNLYYGAGFNHELDLFMLSNANYGIEIEIKISRTDLIKDKEKKHGHKSKKIKHLYFAIPNYLSKHSEHIPLRAGIITVTKHTDNWCRVDIIRKPKANCTYKFSDLECYRIVRLSALRMWTLKKKLWELKNKN